MANGRTALVAMHIASWSTSKRCRATEAAGCEAEDGIVFDIEESRA
jgi:hypothetical protein